MTLLERIKKPNDIKKIPQDSYEELAAEIRQFLVEKVSETGGHLASNLGAVELTMALHLSLNLPEDKIVWDVGHQSYTHKLLTGRRKEFDNLRQYGGLSGFPKRKESPIPLTQDTAPHLSVRRSEWSGPGNCARNTGRSWQ